MKPGSNKNKVEVGDKIRIIHMNGEPQYDGVEGEVTHIGKDCDGQPYYRGTWGGCSVYPRLDVVKKI